MNNHYSIQQVLLIILDGWGYSEDTKYNAIAKANPEYFNHLWNTYPHTLFHASGKSVGLPQGTIGTSEIGHTIIGAGRIVYTDLLRINKAVEENALKQNSVLQQLLAHVKTNNSTLHLLGLVSPGSVHSHQDHLFALLKIAKEEGIKHVAIHVFTDGRDTPPQSADQYVKKLEETIEKTDAGEIASISGRYYAMDRDNNWERTQKVVDVLLDGKGSVEKGKTASDFIKEQYAQDIGDEFIVPTVLNQAMSIKQNDGVLFFNFRPDRARQLSEKIAERVESLNVFFSTMTEYDNRISSQVLFPPEKIDTTLANEISTAGLAQAHIAETEKYAHVTYFLNGGSEQVHPKEQFILVESRKDIPTFDLAPEMKAKEIADKTIEEIDKGTNFIVINFANADMVGHTGKMEPTIKAIKVLDEQIKRVVETILARGGVAFITADHGNAELMFDEKNSQPHTAHTLNPVPAILTLKGVRLYEGTLADVAPTILSLFGLPIPSQMTGKNLLRT